MSDKRKHIVHLTSVHYPFDTRIFLKECRSLVRAGYRVTLVVPHSKDEMVDGIQIKAVPPAGRRSTRMTLTAWQVGRVALRLNADLYHFHDSELIPMGLWLRLLGKKVIYDVHEDVPRALLTPSRDYVPSYTRRPLSWFIEFLENLAARRFSALVAATPTIEKRFKPINQHTYTINNFPILNELITAITQMSWDKRSPAVTYVGSISLERGLQQMIEAMVYISPTLQARLKLAGDLTFLQTHSAIKQLKGWQYVDALGFLSRDEVAQLLRQVRAGVVLFHPEPNHINAQPNKMFEYMSAGLPVIASDFPLWRQIIKTASCGLLVDPLNPKAIAEAIEYLLTHPAEAEALGRRGREAVEKHYNWTVEEAKLLQLYADLLG